VTARIGIIGAGFWAASYYLPFFRDHPDVELVGVVRKTEEGLDNFRRAFDLEVATTSVDELLAAGVDGVVVASPHALHREHAVAALEAGAHVLVEKPMAVKAADARAIGAAATATGRTAAVALGWNYMRLSIWAKEMLDAGRIGRVTSVTGYKASSLTAVFAGVSGYGVVDVAGFPVEAEARRARRTARPRRRRRTTRSRSSSTSSRSRSSRRRSGSDRPSSRRPGSGASWSGRRAPCR
jgi:hypothetical protein